MHVSFFRLYFFQKNFSRNSLIFCKSYPEVTMRRKSNFLTARRLCSNFAAEI
nr:MAG TPA: hypothetical protein [Caudoviricetes sp.]